MTVHDKLYPERGLARVMQQKQISSNPKRFKAYIILLEMELIFTFLTAVYLAFRTEQLLPKLLMTLLWLGTIYLFYQTRINIQQTGDPEQVPLHQHLSQSSLLFYYLAAFLLSVLTVTTTLLFTESLYDFYFASLSQNRYLIPILLFIVFWAVETFIFFPFIFHDEAPDFSYQKLITNLTRPFKSVLFWVIPALMLTVWILIYLTGAGIDPTRANIIDLAVPLLESQTIFLVALCAMLLWGTHTLSHFSSTQKYLSFLRSNNWVFFLLIWMMAIIIWIAQPLPLRNNFILAPQPGFMNEIYPYSDAALFDTSAISLWAGFSGGSIILRPVYVWFLSLFHSLVGFDYAGMVLCQTILLALIPALLFLIGKEIHHPLTGLFAALAAILREINAIQISNTTVTSNTKLLLSDLPCMLVVLLFTLLIIKWIKNQQSSGWHTLWIGALLGIGTLVRTQFLVLLPLPLLFSLIQKKPLKARILQILLMLVGLLIAILPILMRNYAISGSIGFEDSGSIEHYVTRLGPSSDEQQALHDGSSRLNMLTIAAITLLKNPWSFLGSVSEHFIRNLMSTFLIFPIRLGQVTSWKSLFFIRQPFWANVYTQPNSLNILLILLQMLIFSLGLSSLVKRCARYALALIGIFTLYAFSVSLGQFSGWRFILPVDWIGYLIYGLGIVTLFKLFFAPRRAAADLVEPQNPPTPHQPNPVLAIMLTLIMLSMGALVPLQEWLNRPLLPQRSTADVCSLMVAEGVHQQLSMTEDAFQEVCLDEDTVVANGLALYPQFYPKGNGYGDADWAGTIEAPQDFSRLFFTLVGSQNSRVYILTDQVNISLPHGSEVSVIGQTGDFGLEASAILVSGYPGQIQTNKTRE